MLSNNCINCKNKHMLMGHLFSTDLLRFYKDLHNLSIKGQMDSEVS